MGKLWPDLNPPYPALYDVLVQGVEGREEVGVVGFG